MVTNEENIPFVGSRQEEKNEEETKVKKGIINPKYFRIIAFIIMALTIVGCVTLSLMAVWGYTDKESVWKSLATLAIILSATGLLTFLNEKLK